MPPAKGSKATGAAKNAPAETARPAATQAKAGGDKTAPPRAPTGTRNAAAPPPSGGKAPKGAKA
ncbi:hypothetical protein BKA93DRAFT_824128 [Sparassis latifolia]|uniref:Uncharacterized protein n=1 Tax=Sparassis crispa TaxID=139825 RepID=A0A401GW23_9APHY|nr:hypothetical protein SCP_0804880 [Sparassis crispa]GBE85964.1 hypothetical protein SCP_0804880 [Sparassis crispa]